MKPSFPHEDGNLLLLVHVVTQCIVLTMPQEEEALFKIFDLCYFFNDKYDKKFKWPPGVSQGAMSPSSLYFMCNMLYCLVRTIDVLFMLPRKWTEKCIPLADYSRQYPWHELAARAIRKYGARQYQNSLLPENQYFSPAHAYKLLALVAMQTIDEYKDMDMQAIVNKLHELTADQVKKIVVDYLNGIFEVRTSLIDEFNLSIQDERDTFADSDYRAGDDADFTFDRLPDDFGLTGAWPEGYEHLPAPPTVPCRMLDAELSAGTSDAKRTRVLEDGAGGA